MSSLCTLTLVCSRRSHGAVLDLLLRGEIFFSLEVGVITLKSRKSVAFVLEMLFEDQLTLGRASAVAAVGLTLWTLCGIVYRLYLSPIARFPGPWYAAVTLWYEFYWDAIKRGRYEWKIAELHEKYGKIASCRESDFANTLQARSFGSTPTSFISTIQTTSMNSTCQQRRERQTNTDWE